MMQSTSAVVHADSLSLFGQTTASLCLIRTVHSLFYARHRTGCLYRNKHQIMASQDLTRIEQLDSPKLY